MKTGFASETVPVDGVEAKLNIASHAPAEQSRNAAKIRGLKKADSEVDLFRIGGVCAEVNGTKSRRAFPAQTSH